MKILKDLKYEVYDSVKDGYKDVLDWKEVKTLLKDRIAENDKQISAWIDELQKDKPKEKDQELAINILIVIKINEELQQILGGSE